MSKKMQKLLNKFERRVETYYHYYLEGLFDSDKTIEILYDMQKEFDAMRCGMSNYDLITENEFLSTSTLALQIVMKYEKLILGI